MPRVLHIDDSPTIKKRVEQELLPLNIECMPFDNFIELTKIRDTPDLVILDLNMPSMSGEKLGAFVRKFFPDTPIVIFSSESAERLRDAAKQVAAFTAISKSDTHSIASLKAAVMEILGKR